MKRPAAAEDTLRRVEQWRSDCPDITLRSTFIVGFPGETESDFELLLAFLREARLDRVGCFAYSPVDGATANALPGHVDEAVKEERRARLMTLQAEISEAKLLAKRGRRLTVLIDELDGEYAIARSAGDAPEIDGRVYVERDASMAAGEFCEVLVTDSDEHDLWASRSDGGKTAGRGRAGKAARA